MSTHTEATFLIPGKEVTLSLEIAGFLKEKGLMHRRSLPANQGMLFSFSKEGDWEFWMKNTYIPLDLIFIDNSLKVVAILQGVPFSEEVLSAGVDSRYVIETNMNWCSNNGVEVGTEVAEIKTIMEYDSGY